MTIHSVVPPRSSDPSTRELLQALSVHDTSPAGMDRRRFLQGALALGGAAAVGPLWSPRMAAAQGAALGPDERILIVLLMGGGNDGFKMISPLDNATFVGTRDFLADVPADERSIGNGLYLNEFLPDIKTMWDDGDVACVLGVGNPLDDRSHFSSMASWMAGDISQPFESGWIGRHVDGAGYGELGSVSIGNSGVPLHFRGTNQIAAGISEYGNLFGASTEPWQVRRYGGMHRYADGPSGLSPWVDLAADTFSSAIDIAGEINPAYQLIDGEEGLERSFMLAAGLINLDLGARVIGTSYGDFDHHDDQAYPYMQRMTELNTAVTRFYETLDPAFADRVVIATFSEFGRSFTPNGSRGTDHGTASNFMVIGRNVKGGLYGEIPNFTNLDSQGDVEHTVDFRSYYASLLGGWLGADDTEVLGGSFEDLNLFEDSPSAGSGTAALTTSCLNNDGRFDIALVNVGAAATFRIEVSGLPARTRNLAADQSTRVSVTGRQDKAWTVRVLRDGEEIMNETVTVSCDPARPEMEVDQSCLASNGRFDLHLHNGSSLPVTYRAELSGLAPREVTIAPGSAGRITWTGRRDGDYRLRVWRNNALALNETYSVGCDPVTEPIRVETSCLAGNGRVDVHLRNPGAAERTYEVTVGTIGPRTRTVAPNGRTRLSVTGRRDGPLEVIVSSGGAELHRSTHQIACDV